MTGLLIPEIAKWSWCRCRLVSLHDLHSGLGWSWLLPPPCLPSLSPFMISILGCSWPRCRLVSQVWFLAALGCRCRLVSTACLPSWSLLGCFVSQACLPSWFLFWAALGCRALSPKLVSLHDSPSGLLLAATAALSPFMISLLGCCWLPLPPSLPSLSPFVISLLGCSWPPLPPCLLASFPSYFSFELLLAAAATLSPSLFPFMISLPGESMISEHLRIPNKKLLLYEYSKTHFASLEMLSGVYAGVICLFVCSVRPVGSQSPNQDHLSTQLWCQGCQAL